MSEVTAITLKKIPDAIAGPGRGKGPLGKLRTFDGQTFQFGPEDNIIEIVSVRAGKNGLASSRKYQDTDFSFTGKTLRLYKGPHLYIRVEFVREITQEQFEASAPAELVEFQKVMLGSIGGDLKATAESEKMKNLLGESPMFNNPGEIFGGFKGLGGGAKPTKDFVKRCRPVMLQQGTADGSADAVSAQVSNLTTLFGMSDLKTNNLNKVCISQGSRNEIFNELKRNTRMPNSKLKLEMKNILPAGLTSKLISVAEKQVNDKSAGKNPQTNIVKSVKREIKAKSKETNNAGFNFNPDGLIPNAGAPGANVFAHMLGKLKGVFSSKAGDMKTSLPGVASGIKIPKGVTVPNLIEGKNEETGTFSLNTNISKLVNKGNLTPKMAPTNVKEPKKTAAKFNGFSTPANYEFEYIETLDELKDEFEDSKRFQSIDNNAITAVTVGWVGDEYTKKLTRMHGSIKKIDARVLHQESIAIDRETEIQRMKDTGLDTAKAVERANLGFKLNPINYGIMSHYIINSDGTLQRGRPVDVTRPEEYVEFDDTGGRDPIVNVLIVAGETIPVSAAQHKTLKNFLEVVYSVLPGVDIHGHYELNKQMTGPGVDMAALRDALGKSNTIEFPKDASFPTRKEIAFVIPKEVAKTTPTANKKVEAFSFKNLSKKYEYINEETGEVEERDAEKDFAAAKAELDKVLSGEIDIQENMDKAYAENKGSLAKSIGEENVAKFTKIKDTAGGSFNDLIKRINTKESDLKISDLKTKIFGAQ